MRLHRSLRMGGVTTELAVVYREDGSYDAPVLACLLYTSEHVYPAKKLPLGIFRFSTDRTTDIYPKFIVYPTVLLCQDKNEEIMNIFRRRLGGD